MEPVVYRWLTGAGKRKPPLPTHLFACVISERCREATAPLPDLLGLDEPSFADLVSRYFPQAVRGWRAGECFRRHASSVCDIAWEDGANVSCPSFAADEEEDLRQLLLDHRSAGAVEEEWLAAIVARACLRPNHLWQDLGLTGRADLSALLARYFRPLFVKNVGDMKWKKFFYRQLCEREGLLLCKAPVCAACGDYAACFGPEV
jgi:nitrogen fixation protein NifQ